MIELTIIQSDEYANYKLIDKDGNKYDLNINFMGIEKPKVGTEIYIHKSVIEENVSLNYGLVDQENKPKDDELIVISYEGKQRYLQRFYG